MSLCVALSNFSAMGIRRQTKQTNCCKLTTLSLTQLTTMSSSTYNGTCYVYLKTMNNNKHRCCDLQEYLVAGFDWTHRRQPGRGLLTVSCCVRAIYISVLRLTKTHQRRREEKHQPLVPRIWPSTYSLCFNRWCVLKTLNTTAAVEVTKISCNEEIIVYSYVCGVQLSNCLQLWLSLAYFTSLHFFVSSDCLSSFHFLSLIILECLCSTNHGWVL